MLTLTPSLHATSVGIVGALPEPTASASAVWTGDHSILVIGGSDRSGDIRYTLNEVSTLTGAVRLLSDQVPGPVNNDHAFWDPRPHPDGGCETGCLYIPGVLSPDGDVRTLRYDPGTGAFDFRSAHYPTNAYAAMGAWTGQVSYLFGGVNSSLGRHYNIYRYDPQSDSYALMNASLPHGRRDAAVVWAQGYAYILGGKGCEDGGLHEVCDEVLRYNPEEDSIALVGRLPLGIAHAQAVWDGEMILLTGGVSWGLDRMDRVVRYDPGTSHGVTLATRLPERLIQHAAVWAGSALFVIGGDGETRLIPDITRYTLEPAAPARVDVEILSAGAALVEWQAPAPNTYSFLTGYRVYRAHAGNTTLGSLGLGTADWALVGATNSTTTTFVDTPSDAIGAHTYRVTAINAGRDEGPSTTSGNSILVGTLP